MTIDIKPPEMEELEPSIIVMGIGGAGGNAIANMMSSGVEGVEFIVANTDAQALNNASTERRIQLGIDITQGLGAGSRPEVGRAAAEESVEDIRAALKGAHMCFIAAGMGGGTGTGAAPVIAQVAREMGILTVGVVTKPFAFEGQRRMRAAELGVDELQEHVDTLIVIPNQNLFLVADPNTTFHEAFELADDVLRQGVRGITDLMTMPGLINLDFADVRSVMREMGKAMMGTGEAEGDGRAIEAAQKAIANPLLDGLSLAGAKAVIISIGGGEDMRLMEVDEAANHIRELVDPDANIIFGSNFNPALRNKMRISVVATGIGMQQEDSAPRANRGYAFPFGENKAPPSTPDTATESGDSSDPPDSSASPDSPAQHAEQSEEDSYTTATSAAASSATDTQPDDSQSADTHSAAAYGSPAANSDVQAPLAPHMGQIPRATQIFLNRQAANRPEGQAPTGEANETPSGEATEDTSEAPTETAMETASEAATEAPMETASEESAMASESVTDSVTESPAPASAEETSTSDDDELILDSATTYSEETASETAAPIAEQPQAPPPPTSTKRSLFERMARLSRSSKEPSGADEASNVPKVPPFMDRQSNP